MLLFVSEVWVMTPRLEKYLEGFHQRVVQKIVGMVPKCQWGITWVYSPIVEALAKVGMDEIGVYIDHR